MIDCDSIDWAAWLEAIGTVAAFWFAIVVYALDTRKQRRVERSAQARGVSVWLERDPEAFCFVNTSGLPVYDVMIECEGGTATVDVLPPTADARFAPRVRGDAVDGRFLAVRRFSFTDADDGRWERTAGGLHPVRRGRQAGSVLRNLPSDRR